MVEKTELKQRVRRAVETRQDEIVQMGQALMGLPELGFKEHRTAGFVAERMRALGASSVRTGLGVTGVWGEIRGAKPGPTLALMGELDGLPVSAHPQADPDTGAAHACGHNAQLAGMLGALLGLAEAGAADSLSGRIVFLAVPAEEYVDIDHRIEMMGRGEIGCLGGKAELIRLGVFDEVDMAMMVHTHGNPNWPPVVAAQSSNGFIVKKVRFLGRSAHAGVAPYLGVNALNAAQVALTAINAQRETFPDGDYIRVHPIITLGGEAVNAVPAECRIETFVRARTHEAIVETDEKVDRCLRAGAMALGAFVEIETMPGYMPLVNNPVLRDLFLENGRERFGPEGVLATGHRAGSTDAGDLSRIMPVFHPYMGGASGSAHSPAWCIADPGLAYAAPAELMALTAVDLLFGDAAPARDLIRDHPPELTARQYLARQENLFKKEKWPAVG